METVFKKMGAPGNQEESFGSAVRELFGFAVDDYMAKYIVDAYYLAEKGFYCIGFIPTVESYVDMFPLIDALLNSTSKYLAMIVIDTNQLDSNSLENIGTVLVKYGFEELEDVYEDRIVFARH